MLTNKEMLEIFERTESMLKGHFILTSGRHSDTYMQCAKLFVHPKESEKICSALAQKLKEVHAETVASPAVGGIIMGYELARQLDCKNIFFERQDGVMTLRRGFSIQKGARVVVAEDVVTTGGSVKEVIAALQSAGANVVAVASIVDRSNGGIDFGVPFHSLLSMNIRSYEPDACPLCKENKTPAVKPGSRGLK